MRTLILATASAIALGIASPLYAADNNAAANPAPAAPSAAQATGTMQPATPQAGDTMQQTPSMSGDNQHNNGNTASASPSSMDWPRLSQADVQQIQQKLQQNGLYRGKIDGLVGPETQQALRAYQHQNKLPVTATLDPQTLASLNGTGTGTGVGVGSSTPPNSSNDMNMNPSSNAGDNGAGNQSPTMNHQ
jgi:peptidoglycan hydrolase-like protein with peptidoglycan-binding domain